MESNEINIGEVADRVLEKLYKMSPEQLLEALEACDDNSIGYAVFGHDSVYFPAGIDMNEHFHSNKTNTNTNKFIASFVSMNLLNNYDYKNICANDEEYALAA